MIEADALRRHIFTVNPGARALLNLLGGGGEEARIVGGAIRNALLGLPVSDVDIAVTLHPEQVMERAAAAHLKVIPTGLAHGTVTVIVEGQGFEVTTLRNDVETDGRHAVVAFCRDFLSDAMRRDFTVNALSLGVSGPIHDYTGGLDDLAKGHIRFIGDPDQRIREDYLRILRFFRFSASYAQGPLDRAGLKACHRNRAGIAGLSRERIGNEMRKWLIAPRAIPVFDELAPTGFAEAILGIAIDCRALRNLAAFERHFQILPDSIRRLYALTVRSIEDIEILREGLKLSNAERDHLRAVLVQLQANSPQACATNDTLKSSLYDAGRQTYTDWLLLGCAVQGNTDGHAHSDALEWMQEGLEIAEHWSVPENPYNGAYFMKLGIRSGPELGRILDRAEALWVQQGFPDDALRLAVLADEAIAAFSKGPDG